MERLTPYQVDIRLSDLAGADSAHDAVTADDRRRIEWLQLTALRLLIAVTALIAWETVSGWYFDPFWVSRPSLMLAQLGKWIASGSLLFHLQITLTEMALGFVIGSITGIALGLGLGLHEFLAKLIDPFLIGFYSVPKIMLAPLFILWFGIGLEPKIALAATIVFFLVFMTTFSGARAVDPDLVDLLRVIGASRGQVVLKVVLPSTLAWVFAGLRVSVPHALTGAVVGEMFASNKGLGSLIAAASGQFDTAGVFAVIVVLTVLAIGINEAIGQLEGVLLGWRTAGANDCC